MLKKLFGGHTNVGPIKKILMKSPENAFVNQDNISKQWKKLNYFGEPNFQKASEEFAQLTALIKSFGIEIELLPGDDNTSLDSIYAHDPLFIFDKGAVLLNMGKAERIPEVLAVKQYLHQLKIPVVGQIQGQGKVEGGDFFWLDSKTIAIAEGYRTNADGISQLRDILGNALDQIISVPLPHWTGPEDCLHLLSMISPLDTNLALVYSRLMSVPFRNTLLDYGYQLIEVPDEEYESMACNVLAVAPRKCIMLDGNPITQRRMLDAGVEITTFSGQEISLKGAGGPTCLTRPILREDK
ncbi:MAG: hypothetical protein JEZ06_06535 [Anaerolineaceae bacterium]|nr:hypothetical protein [Anaerolineaceae bacterium]